MVNFSIYTPTRIHFGYDSFERIESAKEFGEKALIVIGKGSAKKFGYLGMLEKKLGEIGVEYEVLEGIPENPDEEIVEMGAEFAEMSKPDFFIALGGGSVIDAMKAINAVYSNGISVKECYGKPICRALPSIAIPTTSGTGSEVTRYSIVTDKKAGTKRVISDYKLCPSVAIVDPQFTLKLPKSVTISSGLDALSHCIEALIGYYSNPVIDAIALEGIRIGFENLPKVAENPDRESREKMMLCSLMGGIAINSVPTGLAHAMSYPLTVNFGIPHGMAVAIVLPHVLRLMNYEEKLRRMSEVLGGDAIKKLEELFEILGVPEKVEGLSKEQCEAFARDVMANKEKLRNNVRIPTFEEVREIYMTLRG